MICSNTLIVRGRLSNALPERYIAFRIIHISGNFMCSNNYRILECLILILNYIRFIASIDLRHSDARTIALLRSGAL